MSKTARTSRAVIVDLPFETHQDGSFHVLLHKRTGATILLIDDGTLRYGAEQPERVQSAVIVPELAAIEQTMRAVERALLDLGFEVNEKNPE